MSLRLARGHFGLHSAPVNNQNIKSVLIEERRFEPSEEFTASARLKPEDVETLRAEAASNYKGFWARQAQKELRWHKPFSVTLDESRRRTIAGSPTANSTFPGTAWTCTWRSAATRPPLTFVGEPGDVRHVSYRELHADVCRFANALSAQGVKTGDRVVIYMPHDSRGHRRDARLRAHRRHSFGGVRRLLGAFTERSHRGRGRRVADHRRWRLAWRQGGRAQGSRRQGAVRRRQVDPQA